MKKKYENNTNSIVDISTIYQQYMDIRAGSISGFL